MKRMTKCWPRLAILLLLTLPLMAACGSDEEEITGERLISRAIGTWMCTQSTDMGQGIIAQGQMVGMEVTIKGDGTYTSTAPSFGYSGTYAVRGNVITAKGDNDETFVFTLKVSGDKMSWKGTASNGVSFMYNFVREADDAKIETPMAFTNEMISGTAWKVRSFRIEQGEESAIEEDKTIIFRKDGTCEGLHPMETAWFINNGNIYTYHQKSNEPLFFYTLLLQKGGDITVRISGMLDNDLRAMLTLTPLL